MVRRYWIWAAKTIDKHLRRVIKSRTNLLRLSQAAPASSTPISDYIQQVAQSGALDVAMQNSPSGLSRFWVPGTATDSAGRARKLMRAKTAVKCILKCKKTWVWGRVNELVNLIVWRYKRDKTRLLYLVWSVNVLIERRFPERIPPSTIPNLNTLYG